MRRPSPSGDHVQLELKRDPYRLRSSVVATPGDYDAHPLFSNVQISAIPQTVHPDRAAVAAALLFSPSVAGSFAMEPGCSPLASSAIREWFAPSDVHVLTVDFQPSRITAGDTTLNVMAEGVNDHARPPSRRAHPVPRAS